MSKEFFLHYRLQSHGNMQPKITYKIQNVGYRAPQTDKKSRDVLVKMLHPRVCLKSRGKIHLSGLKNHQYKLLPGGDRCESGDLRMPPYWRCVRSRQNIFLFLKSVYQATQGHRKYFSGTLQCFRSRKITAPGIMCFFMELGCIFYGEIHIYSSAHSYDLISTHMYRG